ncbi:MULTISPECIES: NUDIX hydrolase [unclassified Gordonia (in: high G+C Gram-positive bacteria)]|jgi:hypothetical protein|uniref:hypothetical protein n=1 Tax=Gordonia sp. VNQ95 TaxID=3156619 RepID=UPI0032B55E8B
MLSHVDSRPVYATNNLLVRADTVLDEFGNDRAYGVVEAPDAMVNLARDLHQRVLMVTDTAFYPCAGPRLTVPITVVDLGSGGTPMVTDRTRAVDNTSWMTALGLTSTRPVHTVYLEAQPHLTEMRCRIFLADEVTEVDPHTRARSSRAYVWLTADDIARALDTGQLRDALSIAALGLLHLL